MARIAPEHPPSSPPGYRRRPSRLRIRRPRRVEPIRIAWSRPTAARRPCPPPEQSACSDPDHGRRRHRAFAGASATRFLPPACDRCGACMGLGRLRRSRRVCRLWGHLVRRRVSIRLDASWIFPLTRRRTTRWRLRSSRTGRLPGCLRESVRGLGKDRVSTWLSTRRALPAPACAASREPSEVEEAEARRRRRRVGHRRRTGQDAGLIVRIGADTREVAPHPDHIGRRRPA